MYPRFIELHDYGDDSEMSVNVDSIANFHVDNEGTIIEVANDEYYRVRESYEDVKKLISDAGCKIEKGDPRLDMSCWVPWDELTRVEMIGQPLWNSNSRRWMLLIDVSMDRGAITLLDDCGAQHVWIAHDTKQFPLYRMRRTE